jgi:hypothetical protein
MIINIPSDTQRLQALIEVKSTHLTTLIELRPKFISLDELRSRVNTLKTEQLAVNDKFMQLTQTMTRVRFSNLEFVAIFADSKRTRHTRL